MQAASRLPSISLILAVGVTSTLRKLERLRHIIAIFVISCIVLGQLTVVDSGRAQDLKHTNQLIKVILAAAETRARQRGPMVDVTPVAHQFIHVIKFRILEEWTQQIIGSGIKLRHGNDFQNFTFSFEHISKYSDKFRRNDELVLSYEQGTDDDVIVTSVGIVNRTIEW
jgi:hypothetical protein